MFNFGTVTAEPKVDEVTKEELMARQKVKVYAERAARVAGIRLTAIGAASGVFAGSVAACNKILEGHDEENPAGFLKCAASFGIILLGSAGETAALLGGTALIEEEVESWSDDDFKIEEVEAEDEKEFNPDKRVEFDFLR